MDIKQTCIKAVSTVNGAFNAVKSKTGCFVKAQKKVIAIVAALTVMVMLMSVMMIKRNNVNVYVDGVLTDSFTTFESDSQKWLGLSKVELNEGDAVNTVETDIYVDRAFYVTVEADGVKTTVNTVKCTVEKALELAGVVLNGGDIISISKDVILTGDTSIVVNRVKKDTVCETEIIEYTTKKIKTDELYEGQSEVVTEGENGKIVYTYDVVYTDGVETERTLVSKETVKEAVQKVVKVGTKIKSSFIKTSSTPKSYKAVYTMKASAYTYGEDGGNYTATGEKCRRGIVAVDPRVIPLGTRLYIESTDGKYIYGEAVAADTGGAIKGYKIDIFVESSKECYSFGRRNVNVYILD